MNSDPLDVFQRKVCAGAQTKYMPQGIVEACLFHTFLWHVFFCAPTHPFSLCMRIQQTVRVRCVDIHSIHRCMDEWAGARGREKDVKRDSRSSYCSKISSSCLSRDSGLHPFLNLVLSCTLLSIRKCCLIYMDDM